MKILFVTDKYYPKARATVICAQNVIDELSNDGNIVDVIAYKDVGVNSLNQYNGNRIYYVRPDIRQALGFYAFNFPERKSAKLADKMAVIINRIKKVLYFPFYPLYSCLFPLRLMKSIERLNNTNHYDAIVSIYWPFESVLAGYWFKKKNPNVTWIAYVVDPITKFDYSFLNKFGSMRHWFVRFAEVANSYIYMRPNDYEYTNGDFACVNECMIQSDIPAMIKIPNGNKNGNGDHIINNNHIEKWVYTGSLSCPHYKADDLIDIFLGLPKNKKRELHFYSKGVELDELRKKRALYAGKVFFHDYIPHDELINIYNGADVLVSVKYTSLISAKIFEYMSYGKPIIHISGCENDPNAEYIRNYKRGLVLSVYDSNIHSCIEEIEKKLDGIQKMGFDKDLDFQYFEMNRPQFTARIIESVVQNNEY